MQQPPIHPPEETPPYSTEPPQQPPPGGPYAQPGGQPMQQPGQESEGPYAQPGGQPIQQPPPGGPYAQPGGQPMQQQPPQQQTGGPYAQPGQQGAPGSWITFSQLRGHPLVDTTKGQKVGEVHDILLDHQLQGIRAFIYKAGFFHGSEIVPANQARIGIDAITFQPGTQAGQGTARLEGLPKASEVLGRRILTDTGRLLGAVHDLRFDQNSHGLLGVELAPESGGRQHIGGRVQVLPTTSITSIGPDAIIVSEQTLTSAGFGF